MREGKVTQTNGWRAQNSEHRRNLGLRMRRAARARALQRGEADPIFRPFSKTLTPGFQNAVERYLAERGARKC